MRKVFIALIVFMFIAPTLGNAYSPNYVFDHDPIYVFIDGKEPAFTNEPFFQNGTTLIEFRPVFELLGLQVGWDQRRLQEKNKALRLK
ncbi:hypothetical protein A33I_18380 [Alkalihalophilus marmarensis DSM 21297]|uniref:Copper amine oxidase-like N-terminal domain-containing protein n=1 Tax=Alkalihalophilus marmarensis DSM 21297 TaxID=1188261 RepID=U6SN50_9BACI|nr:hypothetical protein [Alkalihalophilus marmarensis]ERN52061.1 hypothetical protein A33I_18380 [Alkalihalophilus marmarensis DSM 21297]